MRSQSKLVDFKDQLLKLLLLSQLVTRIFQTADVRLSSLCLLLQTATTLADVSGEEDSLLLHRWELFRVQVEVGPVLEIVRHGPLAKVIANIESAEIVRAIFKVNEAQPLRLVVVHDVPAD